MCNQSLPAVGKDLRAT
uniref:Cyclin B2 n=1 Tax=Arundo donax TaxID=35708 RepID=A0A0A9FKI1_ARUDO